MKNILEVVNGKQVNDPQFYSNRYYCEICKKTIRGSENLVKCSECGTPILFELADKGQLSITENSYQKDKLNNDRLNNKPLIRSEDEIRMLARIMSEILMNGNEMETTFSKDELMLANKIENRIAYILELTDDAE